MSWVGREHDQGPQGGTTLVRHHPGPWQTVGGPLDHGLTWCIRPEPESNETCDIFPGPEPVELDEIPAPSEFPEGSVFSLVRPGPDRAQLFVVDVVTSRPEPLDWVTLVLARVDQVKCPALSEPVRVATNCGAFRRGCCDRTGSRPRCSAPSRPGGTRCLPEQCLPPERRGQSCAIACIS